MEENELISLLAKNNSKAQKYLYDKYAAKYNAICLRYLKEIMLAEDALISGFMKIFTKINQYNKSTNFEAWMYKIMINECLMELRKKSNFNLRLENFQIENNNQNNVLNDLYEKDVLLYLDDLPTGCRTIFNLYVIEGYKHNEIAEILDISEGTSKSQLNVAKQKLQKLLPIEFHIKKTRDGK